MYSYMVVHGSMTTRACYEHIACRNTASIPRLLRARCTDIRAPWTAPPVLCCARAPCSFCDVLFLTLADFVLPTCRTLTFLTFLMLMCSKTMNFTVNIAGIYGLHTEGLGECADTTQQLLATTTHDNPRHNDTTTNVRRNLGSATPSLSPS